MNTLDPTRRKVLKGVLASSIAGLAASWGILGANAYAARPESAFQAEDLESALKELFGEDGIEESPDIIVKAPDIAENGAVVPLQVTSNIPNTESVVVLVPENPFPMAASFDVSSEVTPEFSIRIKMGTTSDVIALVKADGKVFRTSKLVEVTIGGCGG